MSTEATSGAEPETQTPPTGEAGCKTEIDRNVLGTDLRSGLAQWMEHIEAEIYDVNYKIAALEERTEVLEEVRAKIRAILDAKDETQRE